MSSALVKSVCNVVGSARNGNATLRIEVEMAESFRLQNDNAGLGSWKYVLDPVGTRLYAVTYTAIFPLLWIYRFSSIVSQRRRNEPPPEMDISSTATFLTLGLLILGSTASLIVTLIDEPSSRWMVLAVVVVSVVWWMRLRKSASKK